jgi:hypothetical protein
MAILFRFHPQKAVEAAAMFLNPHSARNGRVK